MIVAGGLICMSLPTESRFGEGVTVHCTPIIVVHTPCDCQ